jgi:hypothetical protein
MAAVELILDRDDQNLIYLLNADSSTGLVLFCSAWTRAAFLKIELWYNPMRFKAAYTIYRKEFVCYCYYFIFYYSNLPAWEANSASWKRPIIYVYKYIKKTDRCKTQTHQVECMWVIEEMILYWLFVMHF